MEDRFAGIREFVATVDAGSFTADILRRWGSETQDATPSVDMAEINVKLSRSDIVLGARQSLNGVIHRGIALG